ncbi:hypothetical protein YC2023_062059 [Brassica napus]
MNSVNLQDYHSDLSRVCKAAQVKYLLLPEIHDGCGGRRKNVCKDCETTFQAIGEGDNIGMKCMYVTKLTPLMDSAFCNYSSAFLCRSSPPSSLDSHSHSPSSTGYDNSSSTIVLKKEDEFVLSYPLLCPQASPFLHSKGLFFLYPSLSSNPFTLCA